jgi:predicted RNA-binding Zn-ribbon protein involved in translation (DUF1610 family)
MNAPSDPLVTLRSQVEEIRQLLDSSNVWKKLLAKQIKSLHEEIASLRQRLGQYECPSCGEKDAEENRYVHPVSSDSVCFQCGNLWELPPQKKDQEPQC